MQAKGKFIFKSLERKDGGKFTNERGQVINYDASYQLKVDENKDGVINERKLKISQKNDLLIQKLMKKNPYDQIELLCDIEFYGSVAKVIPVDLVDNSNNK
jgi:hypothetical protein